MLEEMSFYRDNLDSLRVAIGPREVKNPSRHYRMLLVDDDESFLRIMQRAAKMKGISLDVCSSALEAMHVSVNRFDVIIVDYLLGEDNGVEAAALCAEGESDLPIILVSQTDRVPTPRNWPESMREFVHKKLGPFAILEAAMEAVEIAEMQKRQAIPVGVGQGGAS